MPQAGFKPGSEQDGCLWRLPSYRSHLSATTAGSKKGNYYNTKKWLLIIKLSILCTVKLVSYFGPFLNDVTHLDRDTIFKTDIEVECRQPRLGFTSQWPLVWTGTMSSQQCIWPLLLLKDFSKKINGNHEQDLLETGFLTTSNMALLFKYLAPLHFCLYFCKENTYFTKINKLLENTLTFIIWYQKDKI